MNAVKFFSQHVYGYSLPTDVISNFTGTKTKKNLDKIANSFI